MAQELFTIITRKGQITAPAAIRRALGLKEGDRIALTLNEQGKLEATLRPAPSIADLTYGALRSYVEHPVADVRDWREQFIEQIIENATAEGKSDNQRP